MWLRSSQVEEFMFIALWLSSVLGLSHDQAPEEGTQKAHFIGYDLLHVSIKE